MNTSVLDLNIQLFTAPGKLLRGLSPVVVKLAEGACLLPVPLFQNVILYRNVCFQLNKIRHRFVWQIGYKGAIGRSLDVHTDGLRFAEIGKTEMGGTVAAVDGRHIVFHQKGRGIRFFVEKKKRIDPTLLQVCLHSIPAGHQASCLSIMKFHPLNGLVEIKAGYCADHTTYSGSEVMHYTGWDAHH